MILWIVLGTAVIVTGFVLVGMYVDRKVPLLPRAGGAAALPRAHAPAVIPGETAATAVRVPDAWRNKIAAGKCTCGQAMTVQSDEPVRLADRRLIVVRLACAACGHARSIYLEPAGATA